MSEHGTLRCQVNRWLWPCRTGARCQRSLL